MLVGTFYTWNGVNIVAERLDGSRRRLAKSLQDCKFSLEIIFAPIGARALRLQPHQPHGRSGHENIKNNLHKYIMLSSYAYNSMQQLIITKHWSHVIGL